MDTIICKEMEAPTKEQKMCTECKKWKQTSDFYLSKKRGKPYRRSKCFSCEAILEGERRMKKNPIVNLKGEIWKSLYDKYEISNMGRFKSKYKRVTRLSVYRSKLKTYRVACFNVDGKHFTKTIHRVVATHFIPNPQWCKIFEVTHSTLAERISKSTSFEQVFDYYKNKRPCLTLP